MIDLRPMRKECRPSQVPSLTPGSFSSRAIENMRSNAASRFVLGMAANLLDKICFDNRGSASSVVGPLPTTRGRRVMGPRDKPEDDSGGCGACGSQFPMSARRPTATPGPSRRNGLPARFNHAFGLPPGQTGAPARPCPPIGASAAAWLASSGRPVAAITCLRRAASGGRSRPSGSRRLFRAPAVRARLWRLPASRPANRSRGHTASQ